METFLLTEFDIQARAPKDADEVEDTFAGNAQIKTQALVDELLAEGQEYPFAVIADDSGLEVRGLDGRPGVHSARYAGDHVSSEKHIEKLLQELNGKSGKERECRYVCALNLWIQLNSSQEEVFESEGYCEGNILEDAKGTGGFGYDPVFWVPELNKRMSEASLDEKNQVSHRGEAFQALTDSIGRDF